MFKLFLSLLLCLTAKAHALPLVRYARGFNMEDRPGYRLLTIADPWAQDGPGFQYALFPRDRPRPKDLPAKARAFAVPLSRAALTSSTQAAFFHLLGLEDAVAGVAYGYLIQNPKLARRYASGSLPEISRGPEMSGGLDLEKLALLKPDVVLCYPTGDPSTEILPKLKESGEPVVLFNEYRETTPLARAEWVKFLAAFFGRDKEAARAFDLTAARYQALSKKARARKEKPSVFLNLDFHGTWWVPSGNSYMAAYLADAGADYLWKDAPGNRALPLTLEAVFSRAGQADFWLLTEAVQNLEEISRSDSRFKLFNAYARGRVYNNNARVNARGGNDFWEDGVARPDEVLSDLVKIFHPDLVPGHEWIWYRKLE